MTIYHGNAKKEWEESLLQEEEHYSPFIDTIYRIETKNGLIEVKNPIWTNVTAIYENDCSHKTYIARFALSHKEKIDFINCEAIGKHVENLCQYVTKGKAILIEGELNIEQYEKDGEKRSYTKVKVDKLEFLSSASNEQRESNNFKEISNDDIPF